MKLLHADEKILEADSTYYGLGHDESSESAKLALLDLTCQLLNRKFIGEQ